MTEEQRLCVTLVNIVRLIVIRDLGEGLQPLMKAMCHNHPGHRLPGSLFVFKLLFFSDNTGYTILSLCNEQCPPPSNVSIMPSAGPMLTLTLCLLTKTSLTLQPTPDPGSLSITSTN